MNGLSVWKKRILTGVAILLPLTGYPEANIPEPNILPGSLVTVSIPDLHGTLDAVQELADRILPEEKRIQVKAAIGGMIGDPELKGLPAGSGVALVWNADITYAILECSPETAESLSRIMADRQTLHAIEGDLLIFGKDPASLEAGKAGAAAVVKTLLDQEALTGAVIGVQSAEMVEKFRPQINFGMMMMSNMMTQNAAQLPNATAQSMRHMARFVEGEMRVLVSLLSQMDRLDLHLLPRKDAFEYSLTFSVRENTHLHALVTAPRTLEPDPMVTTANLRPGMFSFEMFLSKPEALQTFLKAESRQLAQEMSLDPEVMETWTRMMDLWPTLLSGSLAETVGMHPEQGFTMDYMVTLRDPEKFPEFLESFSGLMKPMMAMYEDMGMPMRFELKLNARSHGNLQIHQYDFIYDLENMDPQTAEQIRAMNMAEMKSELTVLDNRLLWTMGGNALDGLIAKIRQGDAAENRLHARSVYPADGFYYYDFNLGEYFAFIQGLMPAEAGLEMFKTLSEQLKEAPPLSGAGFRQENRVQFSTLIPVQIIRAFVMMRHTGVIQQNAEAPAAPVIQTD